MFSKLKNLLTSRASGEAEPGKETPAARLDALLAQGQLNEAFELMKENGYSEVAPLQLQWHTAQQQLAQERIAIDTFNRTQNRIAYALRELAQAPGPPTVQASGEAEPGKETPAARLDALLAQGQLNEAFELMKENGHSEVALLQLQWHTAQQQLEQKRLGTDAFNNTQSRLAHALRELVRAPGRNGGQAQPLPQEKRAQAPTPPSAQAASIDPLKRLAAIDLLAQSRFQEAPLIVLVCL